MIYSNYNDFEPLRLRANEEHGIPPEGKNGFRNGVEVTDGTGKTMNHIVSTPNLVGGMSHIRKIANIPQWMIGKIVETPQWMIDEADSELTEEEMIAQGFINEKVEG